MKNNQRNPIWPYLVVLACLFLLSVAAPRGWEPSNQIDLHTSQQTDASHTFDAQNAGVGGRNGTRLKTPPNIVRPSPAKPGAGHTSGTAYQSAWTDQDNWPRITPHVEQVNEKIAARLSEFAGELRPRFTESHLVNEPDALQPLNLSAQDSQKLSDSSSDEASSDEESSDEIVALPINRAYWPRPFTLDERLDSLSQYVAQLNWPATVDHHLEALNRLSVGDPRSAEILVSLREIAGETPNYARQASPPIARELLAARSELIRRVDLWQVAQVAAAVKSHESAPSSPEPRVPSLQPRSPGTDVSGSPASPARVDPNMQRLAADAKDLVDRATQAASWRDYLMLGTIADLARRNGEQVALERRRIAQQVLRRMQSPQLTPDQQQIMAAAPLASLARGLRSWAAEPIDVAGLLHTIEEYEADRLPSAARPIAEQIDQLRWSLEPADQRLAEYLDQHYRNANVRLVVTADLLNRVLPQPAPQSDVVNDNVLGVPTHGYSTTSTRLRVRLVPDAAQFVFGIEAAGVVDSQTTSTSGPVTFVSQGEATYRVGKLVSVGEQGLRVTPAEARAESASTLAGMNTEYDSIPLVRGLVRNYALSQHEQMQSSVQREVEGKVASRACQRFDSEIDTKLATAERDFRNRLMSRLDRLSLGPTVMAMQTNDQRMTARLRLAGNRQLGSHTPRPLAMSDSLASVQLHETALNNGLDQLQLAGRTFTLPELHSWVAARVGQHDARLPADLPEHVTVTFAEFDPISVRCDEGRIQLTIAIAELDQGKRVWTDFEVTTYYRPQVQGLTLQIVRDGTIELGGEAQQGRFDVILRGIFAKILARERRLNISPFKGDQPGFKDVAFVEPTIENGWVNLAIAPRKTSKSNVAKQPGVVR